jgi:cofilin
MADANYPMHPDCMEAFNAVKDPNGPTSFVIFKIEHEQIAVDQVGNNSMAYADFVALLPAHEPRFCVYDYNYQNDEGHKRSKLVFIFWSPESVNPRLRMTYATGQKGLVRRLQGIQREVQATDLSEVQATAIESSFRFS